MSFGVDTEAMQRAAGQIGVAAEQLDALIGRMRNDVNEMLGGWDGPGARAHRNLHDRYESDVRTINTNLRQMQTALQRTHALYVNQEGEQSGDHTVMRNTISSNT